MMRKLVLAVVGILVFAVNAAGQARETELKPPASREVTVTLELPDGWYPIIDPKGIWLSTTEANWQKEKHPPAPHPWLVIQALVDTTCESLPPLSHEFKFNEGRSEASLCRDGVIIRLGYHQEDTERERHVREMLEIAENIRRASPSVANPR